MFFRWGLGEGVLLAFHPGASSVLRHMTRDEIAWVNENVSLVDLVKELYGVELHPGYTTICPFHHDHRKSAKVFNDNALVCFAERKTYRSYDVLKLMGVTDEVIRGTYHVPTNLKPRPAWQPPPQYVQACTQLRMKQHTVEEVMRVWEYIVDVMKADEVATGAKNGVL